jgi:hypothetical protein
MVKRDAKLPTSRMDTYTKAMLTAIAVLLGLLALRPSMQPAAVHAQADYAFLFIEPGTTALRSPDGNVQVQGIRSAT